MHRRPSHGFVMAALSIALTWPSMPLAQSPTPTIDADAQAIYAVLLPPMWAKSGSKGVRSLQRETVKPLVCRGTSAPSDAEWDAAEKNYAANTRVQILPTTLRLGVPSGATDYVRLEVLIAVVCTTKPSTHPVKMITNLVA